MFVSDTVILQMDNYFTVLGFYTYIFMQEEWNIKVNEQLQRSGQ